MRLLAHGAVVTAALLAACASRPPVTARHDAGQRSVQIQRTALGVAHIQAADFEALAYGVAYAQAEDKLCETADQLVTARGERSRFFGAQTAGQLGRRALRNEQIDIYVRGLMDDGELALAESRVSETAKAMARGYVAGYNRFLQDSAAGTKPQPAPCAGEPWLRPMTLADYRRLNELTVTQLGAATLADAVVAARLPERGVPPPRPVSAAEALRALADYRLNEPAPGGNAWAFGAETSDNGRGLLASNLHSPWSGAGRYWQMHLTVPGQLDAMGVGAGVLPLVQAGFNHDLAWSQTGSTGRRFTLHELKLVPDDPARYLVGGQAERMRARTVTYEALKADGTLERRLHTVWMTRYGPVVALPGAGLNWTPQTAYALQDANAFNLRGADAWLAVNRAGGIADLLAALRQQGMPTVNTIAADRHGDVLYADASAVPDVDAAQLQRCAPSKPAAALASAGLVVLDGARADCQWRKDPAAPAPGLIPLERLPKLERRDWVQNANDSYWLGNPALALDGISPLVGAVGVPQGLRTRASMLQVLERLAAQDGLAPHARVGPEEARTMLLANRNQAAALVLDDLLAACAGPVAAAPDAAQRSTRVTQLTPSAPAAAAVAVARPAAAAAGRGAQVAKAASAGSRGTKVAAATAAKGRPGVKAAAKPPISRVASAASKAGKAGRPAPAAALAKAARPGLAIESLPPTAAGVAPAAAVAAVLPALDKEACGALAAWDRRDDLESRGALLFRTWWQAVQGTPGLWRVAFSTADPVHTPAGLKMNDAKVRARVIEALAQAAASLRAAGLALDVPLGDVQFRQTATGRVALHGGSEAEGVLNQLTPSAAPANAVALEVESGTGYLQAVGFDERGPVAQGMLSYGQSSQAGSPRAYEPLPLFSQKQWPELPFRPDDVAKARVGAVLTLVLESQPTVATAANPFAEPASAPASGPPAAAVPTGSSRSRSH